MCNRGIFFGSETFRQVQTGYVHQTIPDEHLAGQPVYIAPAPPGAEAPVETGSSTGTEADKLRAHYLAVGEAQGHKFGEGLPGSKPPDFNLVLKPGQTGTPGPASGPAKPVAQAAPAGKPIATASSAPAAAVPGPRPPAPASGSRPPAPAAAPGPPPPAPDSSVPVSERPHNE